MLFLQRASIAAAAALIILLSTSSVSQIAAILLGGLAGLWLCRAGPPTTVGHVTAPVSRAVGLTALAAFFLLLAGLPVLRGLISSQGIALFEAFYRSGALVFGGGKFLRIVDLAQIQHVPLHHAPAGDAGVFDNAPIAMLLAILPADFAAQERSVRAAGDQNAENRL
jgi:hypothetical protein